jgi:hypothetical protein
VRRDQSKDMEGVYNQRVPYEASPFEAKWEAPTKELNEQFRETIGEP